MPPDRHFNIRMNTVLDRATESSALKNLSIRVTFIQLMPLLETQLMERPDMDRLTLRLCLPLHFCELGYAGVTPRTLCVQTCSS